MYVVAAFYQFTSIRSYAAFRQPLISLAAREGLTGTILLAAEGINGTIAGSLQGVDAMLAQLRQLPGCECLEHKQSQASGNPFMRMKVRLKKEIVTMGVNVDALADVGTYIEPADWNALISDPEVALIDARNAYEIEIGTFDGAIDPETESFGELPQMLDEFAKNSEKKKLAMFCTGGIRCEKATAYAKGLGFEDVYHLKGGILKYLEVTAPEQSIWTGECYVFDRRVSVGHGLVQGQYTACGACGFPVSEMGRAHDDFEPGVSCARCNDYFSDQDRARFRDRQRHFERVAQNRDDQAAGIRRSPE